MLTDWLPGHCNQNKMSFIKCIWNCRLHSVVHASMCLEFITGEKLHLGRDADISFLHVFILSDIWTLDIIRYFSGAGLYSGAKPPYQSSEILPTTCMVFTLHDDVIKWKHFPRYWPFVRGIHRSPVNSPHKCQWRGALMSSLICVWINMINCWVNNREAGDLRRYRAHHEVIVMRLHYLRLGIRAWAKVQDWF